MLSDSVSPDQREGPETPRAHVISLFSGGLDSCL